MILLIVDADDARRAQLKERMQDFDGSEVVCFWGAQDALAWSKDHRPDCVVFSNALAGMGFLEFFEAFRDLQRNELVPAIIAGTTLPRDLRHRALALGVTEIIEEPVDFAEFPLRVSNLLSLRVYDHEQTVTANWLASQVQRATSMIREREHEIILRLSHLAEYRDPESTSHILRVAEYCEAIARGAGLGKDFEETMRIAAPMHDIGKIAIPDYLFQKRSKLTMAEVELMKQHTTIGYEILAGSTSPLLQVAADIAVSHHEKYDGSGYPHARAGTAIPLGGRVCAVADAFDAMTSERAYRSTLSAGAVLSELERCSGSHFDPALVVAFKSEFQSIQETLKRRPDDRPQ